jgi:hypothetical protein
MVSKERLSSALAEVLVIAKRISEDVTEEVEKILEKGLENPLTKEEVREVFSRIVMVMRKRALERGEREIAETLSGDMEKLLDKVLIEKEDWAGNGVQKGFTAKTHTVQLIKNHNGITPCYIIPRPWFHGKEIPMCGGYIKTTDIQLWEENVRLDIHLGQFKERNGRAPSQQ